MNQIFSTKRFAMLFNKHVVENYKNYLMSAGVLAGILFIGMGLNAYANSGYLGVNAQTSFFITGMLLAGSIFTSLIFADLGNKKEAISALTLPASAFEKYLVNWLITLPIFILIFTGTFYFVVAVIISFGSSSPGRENQLLNIFSSDQKAYYSFIIYLILHAIIFFGAIYFEKLHFIKTAFAFFIGIFLLGMINKPVISAMIDKKIPGVTIFSPVSVVEGDQAWTVHVADTSNYQTSIVAGLVVIILWASAYYKLKEKEV